MGRGEPQSQLQTRRWSQVNHFSGALLQAFLSELFHESHVLGTLGWPRCVLMAKSEEPEARVLLLVPKK